MVEVRLVLNNIWAAPQVGVLKSKLYIVGGVDKRNSSLNSAECYDSEAGRWTPVANMSQPR